MNPISIFLKAVICVLVCIFMSLSMIFVNIMSYDFHMAMIWGGICGIIIAAVTKSDTGKNTMAAGGIGLFSSAVAQLLLLFSDVPYDIIKLIYGKQDLAFYGEEAERWFSDMEHFMENEVSIYDSCVIFFLYGLFASFCAAFVVKFAVAKIRNLSRRM